MFINEQDARRNKENISYSDYKEGSATREYSQLCKEADEQAAKYSDNPKAQEAANKYKLQMGNWINKKNASGAGHVSVMIAGPSNYNMKKHNRWMASEGKAFEEYDKIQERFNSAMRGAAKPVIKSTDNNALEALQEKLAKAEAEHQGYKDYNKKARKEGTEILAGYVLTNSNGRLRAIRQRIESVEKTQAREVRRLEFAGGYVVENKEAGRTQIFFEDKPDAATRSKMKSCGWRWAPSQGAWQRQMTNSAWFSATHMGL